MATPPASASSDPPPALPTERAPAANRLRFPRRARLSRQSDFRRVLRTGVRACDEYLTVWLLPNGLPETRLGLTVGHRHGGAVRRNRLKRIMREAFRLRRAELPTGFDLVCTPRPGVSLTLLQAIESLTRLTVRLARRAR